MMRSVRVVVALLSLFAGPASAADLYTARVPIADAGNPAREAALRTSLDVVLGRLLPRGQDATRAHTQLAARAEALLAGYRYVSDGRQFEARFDAPALHAELRRAGFAPWGEPRPRVLLWLAFDGGAGAELVGADSPLAGEVERAAQRRGVPVELPLLDPDERAQVDVGALVRLDWESLAAASVDYEPDAFAALLVTGDAARLRGRVNLSQPDGETSAATLQAETLEDILDGALGHVATELAGFYLARDTPPDPSPPPPRAGSPGATAPPAESTAAAPFERPRAGAPVAPGPAGQARAEPLAPSPGPGFVPLTGASGAAVPLPPQDSPVPAAPPQPPPMTVPAASAPATPVARNAAVAGRVPARAPVAGQADGVVVQVRGVGSAHAYQQAQAQLRGLDGVRAVHALAATPGVLTLEVRYPPGAAALRRALSLDAVFEVVDTGGDAVTLRYRGG